MQKYLNFENFIFVALLVLAFFTPLKSDYVEAFVEKASSEVECPSNAYEALGYSIGMSFAPQIAQRAVDACDYTWLGVFSVLTNKYGDIRAYGFAGKVYFVD